MAYCIIKLMKTENGIELPVVLLDNHDEVWEFEDVDIAIKMSEILDVEPIKVTNNIVVEPLNDIDDDAEFARQNIRHLIEKGNDAMEGILNVARASDHPRAYEVAANMLKHLTDMNKDLMEIQKRKKDLQPKESLPTNGINVDKAVFVGSTKELVKLLKSKE